MDRQSLIERARALVPVLAERAQHCEDLRRLPDETLRDFPASIRRLEKAEPIYRTFPGWEEPIGDARDLDELPAAAREYLRWIEAELGVPTHMIGLGAERDAFIERADPFAVPPAP